MTYEEADKRVDAALAILREHFDSIQVCASWTDAKQTYTVFSGSGNWYARVGMCRQFVKQDEAQILSHEMGKIMPKEPPDDSESWKL